MAEFINKKQSECGMVLGGIGTGSIELLPDSQFHFWQIANVERWAKPCGNQNADNGEDHVNALEFYIRTKKAGRPPVVRKLGQRTSFDDFTYTMFGWNKPVEQLRFEAKFPVCTLQYRDKGLPVSVKCKATAPFVPHELDTSATPGFYLEYEIKNESDSPLEVSLLGTLCPDFITGRQTGNRFASENGVNSVTLYGTGDPKDRGTGNVCFSVSGDGEKSHVTADYTRFFREYVAYSKHYGVSQESLLFYFRENGCLPDSAAEKVPPMPNAPEQLSRAQLKKAVKEIEKLPSANSFLSRIRAKLPGYPDTEEELLRFFSDWRELTENMGAPFGGCALSSKMLLAPRETKNVMFVFSWYFPNHYSSFTDGKQNGSFERLGHYYENLFGDSAEANRFLTNHKNTVQKRAEAFSELLYHTSMPAYWSDAWSGQLSTVVKSSWLIKDKKFGLWEGLGYCGFHTTDITYHASFGLTALFPELQLSQMRMGAAFQREDGRVHHFFTPDLSHVDNGYDRVDMNPQFVLMLLRDYLYTGDRHYLSELYPNALKAMNATLALDTDMDGLPDRDTARNTYDSWDFQGASAYISVLWLSALKAAVILADFMDDTQNKEKWNALLKKGLKSLEDKLYNGLYYDLWKNGDRSDAALMTDQLDGEWFLRMCISDTNFSDVRVRGVLRTVFEQNFDPECGLKNATCPKNRFTSINTYKNCQAGAVWTGIGYVFSALALSVGLNRLAELEMKTIHHTQNAFGKLFDHWECGSHYTRPLSSFTTLIALLGLKVNAPKKLITLHPANSTLTAPLITPFVLATVSVYRKTCNITVIQGSLKDWTIRLPVGMDLTITEADS